MTEYINMWKNYFNFTDRTTVRGYWMAFLFHFIVAVIISVLFVVIIDLVLVSSIFALASFIPQLAIMVRRLRDAGKHWACIFLSLIPLVGIIILIVFLVKASAPDSDGAVV